MTGGSDVRLDVAFSKTAMGRRYLQLPPVPGCRGWRSLLIMMDGRKTLMDLWPVIRSMGLSLGDVQAMVERGLLEPAGGLRPRIVSESPGPLEADEPAQDQSVGGDTVPMPLPESAATPQPDWLRPARLFAVDLLTHMLGRPGSLMHDRLQAIDSAPGMMAWIDQCALFLAAAADAERAERFRVQVTAFVPPALRGAAAQAASPVTLADLVPGWTSWFRPPRKGGPRGAGPAAGPARSREPPQPTTGPGALMEED